MTPTPPTDQPKAERQLSDNEIRVAIAEACGWKKCSEPFWKAPEGGLWSGIPSYLTSLDAMHEAEKVLTRDQCHQFQERLLELVREEMPLCNECENGKPWALRWTWHAPARSRALAFYATVCAKGE